MRGASGPVAENWCACLNVSSSAPGSIIAPAPPNCGKSLEPNDTMPKCSRLAALTWTVALGMVVLVFALDLRKVAGRRQARLASILLLDVAAQKCEGALLGRPAGFFDQGG